MIFGDNQGKKTESTKQAILSYLWDNHLQVGDRIPIQAELCHRLGVGGTTVNRAVQALVADNILEARRGIGVFVKTKQPLGHPGRAIGIVGLIADQMHLFNWTMAYVIQNTLQQRGCSCTGFPFRDHYQSQADFSCFPGLESQVAARSLQGIITITDISEKMWNRLEKAGIQVCFVGPPNQLPGGIFLDTEFFIREALAELRLAGCQRPLIVIGPISRALHDVILRLTADFSDAWEFGYAEGPSCCFEGYGIEGGRAAARAILAHPAEQRPDGIVICDDIIEQGFFSELTRRQNRRIEYLPPAVCLRNRQIEIDVPTEQVLDYQVDIYEMSTMAVEMLLDQLQGKRPGRQIVRYRPKRAVPDHLAAVSELPLAAMAAGYRSLEFEIKH